MTSRTVRIGVVADTHVGETLPVLPESVLEALAGSDLILHAGDITCLSVLDRLGEIAPVVAVQGDHDRDAGIDLPTARIITVRGWRMVVVPGQLRCPPQASAWPDAGRCCWACTAACGGSSGQLT